MHSIAWLSHSCTLFVKGKIRQRRQRRSHPLSRHCQQCARQYDQEMWIRHEKSFAMDTPLQCGSFSYFGNLAWRDLCRCTARNRNALCDITASQAGHCCRKPLSKSNPVHQSRCYDTSRRSSMMHKDLAHTPPYHRPATQLPYQQQLDACRTRSFQQGEQIYSARASGIAWRVSSGSVRLNRMTNDGQMLFANLAVAGDVIGTETLLMGKYEFWAVALSDCELVPWPEGLSSPSGDSLLHILAAAERRTADVVALRSGAAIDRVMRLIVMLAQRDENHDYCFALPKGRDISEITDLAKETISRMISSLKQDGIVRKKEISGHANIGIIF